MKNGYLSRFNTSEQFKNKSKELKEFLNAQNNVMLRYDESLVKRLIDTVVVCQKDYQVKLKSGVSFNIYDK